MNQRAIHAEQALSQLIGLIYCTADEPTLWPDLLREMSDYLASIGVEGTTLQGLAEQDVVAGWFDGTGMPVLTQASAAEGQVFALLAPHFARAHEIHRQSVESGEHQRLLERALDRMPLGIAITDISGTVISMNRPLLGMLQGSEHLAVEAGRLVSRTSKSLLNALQRAAASPDEDVTLRLCNGDGDDGLSIHACKLSGGTPEGSQPRMAVFVASRSAMILAESNLHALYGTTAAEAKLIQQLMLGATLETAAKELRIGINTSRTQLQSIFRKVGVRRQSELVHAIHSSLGRLRERAAVPDLALADATAFLGAAMPVGDSWLALADGRRLSWSDTGDEDAIPVIFMHGVPGSRVLRHPDERLLSDAGIRLIIPERPGIGDSDPHAGRTIADWPRDVEALADHLGIASFAVAGFSAGTAYALATARHMPARVKALHLIGAAPPIETMSDLKYYSPQFRAAMMVARFTPALLAPLLGLVLRGVKNNVYRYAQDMMCGHAADDQRAFDSTSLRENFVAGLVLGYGNAKHVASDVLLMVNGWRAADLQPGIPAHFIHGEADWHISAEGAMRVAEQIDGAQFQLIPGAGHFLIYSHWTQILNSIRRAYMSTAT